MNKKSIWESGIKIDSFPILDKNIKTNVLIIGGGIAGLLLAYELDQRHINYMLVEQDKIGRGITKNTTAFITAQHETLYQDLIERLGKEKARQYLDLNLYAVSKYKKLGRKLDIDYQECASILFTNEDEEIILKEKEALDSLDYKSELVDKLELDIPCKKGIKFNNQGRLHPLKLVKEISKDLIIYEHTKIDKLKAKSAITSNGYEIKFNKVVVATHYPFINRVGLFFMKNHQRRSYVCAIKHPSIKDTICSIDDNGLYFRSQKDYLIVGGDDRDTKKECICDFQSKVKEIFNKPIEYSWSNQDCITLDGIPYIGGYSILHKNWYVITGFNMWGFTWAMASSFIIADLIEKKRKYPLVDPKRNMFGKELLKNVGTTLSNLVNPSIPRCSHMGGALKYNEVDRTWECPIHGSRFDEDGNVLDGPAKKNMDL